MGVKQIFRKSLRVREVHATLWKVSPGERNQLSANYPHLETPAEQPLDCIKGELNVAEAGLL